MTIELDKRTVRAIAVEVAKLIRGEGISDVRLIPCSEAAKILGISQDRLRKTKDKYPHVKRGEGQRARLYFDADKLVRAASV